MLLEVKAEGLCVTENCPPGDKGVANARPRVRCRATNKDLAKINCKLGPNSLSGQVKGSNLNRQSGCQLFGTAFKSCTCMTGQFKQWNAILGLRQKNPNEFTINLRGSCLNQSADRI